MELFKAVRYIFVFIQSVLAVQFILDSINEWSDAPIVSSGISNLNVSVYTLLFECSIQSCLVTIEDVNQEQLPAISICIPTSLKWPGVIKAMGQTYPKVKQDMYWDSSLQTWQPPLHVHWFDAIYTYLDKIMSFNNNHIEKLFPVNDHKKDFAKWFLNVIFNMKDDPIKVNEFSVGPFYDAIGIATFYTDLDTLHSTNIEMMKDWICNNQNMTYCEGITNESIESTYQNCASTPFCSISQKDNYFISFDYNYDSYMFSVANFKVYLTMIWLFAKYWRSEKILEYYVYNLYNNPEYSSSKLKH